VKWSLAGIAAITIALCVLAPLRQLSGDTVAGRIGGAVLRCTGSFDLSHLDWVKAETDNHGVEYYFWPDIAGEYTSVFGPGPAVVGAVAVADFGEGATISDDALRRRERDAAGVLLAIAAVLLVIACCARTTWPRALIGGGTAVLSFAGAATLGQGLWQATTALPPLMAGLALVAWKERAPRLAMAAPAALLLAVMLRPTIAPVAIAIGIAWVDRDHWRDRKRWLVATGLAAVVVAPLVAWNAIHYFSPLPLGQWHANARQAGNVFGAPTAIAGLLVSPARGLLWFAPVALVGVATRLKHPIAIGVIVQVLAMAAFFKWHGGQAFGPRLLAEATWVAIWLACDARWAALVPAIGVTVIVGQLGLWKFQPEQWEARRRPEAHPDAFWDIRDNPITSVFDPVTTTAYDSPPKLYLRCDHGTVRSR
jgi:hypothetical protein